jgi:hypothetical protein
MGAERGERPAVEALVIGDPPERWARIGFRVDGDRCDVGSVRLRFDPAGGPGLRGWSVRGLSMGELDGLPLLPPGERAETEPGVHANGAVSIDHVVVLTPDLERTCAALEHAGVRLRRLREAGTEERPVRQAFFRMGEVILEAVSSPEADSTSFWGLVVVVDDIERAAWMLGDDLGEIRDAVQPGRRIATVRRSAGLSVPLALMTPEPPR